MTKYSLHNTDHHEVHDKMIDKFLAKLEQYEETCGEKIQQKPNGTQDYIYVKCSICYFLGKIQ